LACVASPSTIVAQNPQPVPRKKRLRQSRISLFVDIDRARVVFATAGTDVETIAAFADDLKVYSGDPDAVAEVCIDMSPAFIKGTPDSLPNAAITFDKFHVVKIINDAVDQVRRTERKDRKLLVGMRCLWLRNPDHLSERQRAISESLPMRSPQVTNARCYTCRAIRTSDVCTVGIHIDGDAETARINGQHMRQCHPSRSARVHRSP
jgi:transposase